MDYLKKHILSLVLYGLPGIFLFTGCENIDPSGFFYSSDNVNERFAQSMEWNRAADTVPCIEIDSNAYSFMAVGDVHVGGTRNLRSFLQKAVYPDASFMVLAGDLTTGRDRDMAVMKDVLESDAQVPWYAIAGNHDLYYEGWPSYLKYFGSSTYWMTVKTRDTADLFIFLDTGSAMLGKDQTAWLKNLLKEKRQHYRYCFIIGHTNLFRSRRTTSTNPLVDELYLLMDLCIDYDVDMVITGHDHKHSDEQIGNTTYLILDALLDGYKYASYLKVDVADGGISRKFYPVD